MNRLLSSLIGAGLAALMTGAAYADTFTIVRTVDQSTITNSGPDGAISLTFTGLGVATPEAEAAPPGTSLTLLNYRVTSSGPASPTTSIAFDDAFTLSVLFTNTSYTTNNTRVLQFDGRVRGTANAFQNNLVVELTPTGPESTAFEINNTLFTLSNFQRTLPPATNDPSFGAISAQIVSAPIPEPGSMALLGAGLLPALAILRRRR